ncbi:MAG: alpha/beta hydrolase [Planctomycetota bacterium]
MTRLVLFVLVMTILACQEPKSERREPAASRVAEKGLEAKAVTYRAPDGGEIHADESGEGERSVLLAHGGRFDKESWSEQARALAKAGFRVLAIDFRGYGQSKPGPGATDRYAGLYLDVLGGIRYLRETGAKEVSVVGGSMGGWAAAEASIASEPGELDRLVLLASSPVDSPEKLKGKKLFLIARDDPSADGTPRLLRFQDQYERAPEPKELVILDGAAHAQHIFGTDQGERLMQEILRFLK